MQQSRNCFVWGPIQATCCVNRWIKKINQPKLVHAWHAQCLSARQDKVSRREPSTLCSLKKCHFKASNNLMTQLQFLSLGITDLQTQFELNQHHSEQALVSCFVLVFAKTFLMKIQAAFQLRFPLIPTVLSQSALISSYLLCLCTMKQKKKFVYLHSGDLLLSWSLEGIIQLIIGWRIYNQG